MLIVGAKGFAKEVLEIVYQQQLNDIVFYDDVSEDLPELLYGKYIVLRSLDVVKSYYENMQFEFTVGIGNSKLREKMLHKFEEIGGVLCSTISKKADIGSFDVKIKNGTNILDGVKISNSVSIGKAALIYYNSIITHDCQIGDFVEISPNATILGRVKIGDFTQIGANATILPNILIGKNVIVGAGAVVTKDLPDNCVAMGIPAKIIKQNQ